MNNLKVFIKGSTYLMVVAFVFGVVAFVKANKNGELKNLYKAELPAINVIDKDIGIEDFSRGEINPEPPKVNNSEIAQESKKVEIAKKVPTIKKINNKGKKNIKKNFKIKQPKIVSFKSFSRGSLDLIPEPKILKEDK